MTRLSTRYRSPCAPTARPSPLWRSGWLHTLTLVACIGACSNVSAEQDTRWSLGIAGGSSSDNSNALRIAATKPWKRRWFDGGTAHLTGYWEASLARFENDVANIPADDGTAHLWNLAIAPVFRLQFTLGENFPVQPFLDLGVGVSFMSDREFRTGKQRSRPLGSFFQFEDRGAAGVKIGRWEIAYQRMHYSNLNFASENNGIDAHLLLVRGAIGRR